MDEDHTGGKSLALGIIAGVAIGALIGAALGVLFAPQAGRQTREKLGDNIHEMFDKVKGAANTILSKGKETVGQAASDMGDAVG